MAQFSFDNSYKKEVIQKYLLPALGCCIDFDNNKFTEIVSKCKLQYVVKFQLLETPGPRDEGHLWFSLNTMAHSYFYNREKNGRSGTRIWNKRDFIFDDASLLAGRDRSDYLEVLEGSEILSISYADLDALMGKYEDIDAGIKKLSVVHTSYFQRRSSLMHKTPLERVKQFRHENSTFLHCSSQEIQAIHVNLSRRAFINQLNKLK